uniref:dITP/XTP pyrophosphatase n=1 Tax=uncultured Alphaproteobacteria bacterium TaxID=91750 RepID=A0A6M4NN82_9PROT|nr:non-canonical purine NTP pyrophosphatase [uncultured Alphaproteobacteria bacterium]
MKITKLVVASHNAGKIAEIKTLLAPLKIEVQSAAELRLGDVEETGTTFEENAKIKANAISLMCGLPCLADDSGLCVDVLDGRPGVYSARYAPDRNFKEGMKMLLNEIKESGSNNRKAHFSCCLALACPNQKTKIFEGRVDGSIAQYPKGSNGFGYDPIFIPEGYEQTFAELGDDVKNQISHRRRALEKFIQELK